jgi:stage V sporulation protein AC
MNKIVFTEIVKDNNRRSYIKEYFLSFIGGGLVGLIGQLLIVFYEYLNLENNIAITLASLTIVSIVSVLTILGLYNKIGQIFGAGLFVPISGFSNSMTSASYEGKSEGLIYGIGSRIFSLAGSVISYGIFFSIFVVLIRYLLSFFGVSL